MKSMLNLWKNESIKLFCQTANRVILIITLVLSVLLPVAVSAISNVSEDDYFIHEDYRDMAEDTPDYADKVYFLAMADVYEFFENGEIPDWKRQEYYSEYQNAVLKKYVCEGVINGRIDAETACNYYPELFYGGYEIYYGNDDGIYVQDTTLDETEDAITPEEIDFEGSLKEAEESMAQLEKQITEESFTQYASNSSESAKLQLKDAKLLLKEVGTDFDAGNATLGELNSQKLTVEDLEFTVNIYEAMSDASENNEAWMMKTVLNVLPWVRNQLVSNFIVDEEEYLSELSEYNDTTYGEYVENCKKEQGFAREALITIQYAFENEIPLPQVYENSTKSVVLTSLSGFASVIILVMVILTANTVAGEYSQGTVRLLLIRPRTRIKIIFSKFLALFTTGATVSVLSYIVIYLTSIIINGVGDAFASDLMYSSHVIEIAPVLYSGLKYFLSIFSGILLIAFAFLMAVVTKKAMLSILLPLIISFSSFVIQILSVVLIDKYPFIKFTVMPYLDLGNYLSSPIARYTGDSSIIDAVFGGVSELFMSAGINLILGIIIIAVYILVLFTVSFAVFRKQQIKS